MIDGSFIDKIADLVKATPEIVDVDGKKYSTVKLHQVFEEKKPPATIPTAIELGTLAGLAEYVNSSGDIPDGEELFVRILDHKSVSVHSFMFDEHCQRKYYATCKARGISEREFNRYMSIEDAIVTLRTYFEPTEERDLIVSFISSVIESSDVTIADDGVSQTVQVRKGISRKEGATVPDVISLKPYRTFAEVAQPASPYIVRMKQGPEVAFFASQSPQWQVEAINYIAAFLKEKITRANTHVIA